MAAGCTGRGGEVSEASEVSGQSGSPAPLEPWPMAAALSLFFSWDLPGALGDGGHCRTE